MDSTAKQPVLLESYDPQRVSTMRRVFIGSFGLRAGWSLLIYFTILSSIIFSGHLIRHHVEAKHSHNAVATRTTDSSGPVTKSFTTAPMLTRTFFEDMTFPVLFFLSWLMAAIEHRKLSTFGLGGVHSSLRFLIGAAWGFFAMSLLIATLYSFHLLSFDSRLLHGRAILRWGLIQFFLFLFVGLVEEYTFRGYLQFTLTRGLVSIGNLISRQHARAIAFWLASSVTSVLFLLAHTHNGGENKLGLLQVFVVGIVFVTALWRTGSLWWAIGFHMAWDWAQSFLYGVPDSGGLMQGHLFATHAIGNSLFSGGTDGPEGSVLCIPLLLLVIVVLFFTHTSPQPGAPFIAVSSR
jgi:membrane protease YdiL (CAAX protease family)